MNTIRREALLLRKRYLIWGVLAVVVFSSYSGFFGYLPFWIWRNYRMLAEMDRNITFEQLPLAKTLLWQSALCRMGLNRFNLIVPAALSFCSIGMDTHKGRLAVLQAYGKKAWRSSYLVSFLFSYLVTIIIVLISVWMQVLRTRPIFQEVASAADFRLLGKPLLYLLVSFFCYTAVSHLISFLAGGRNVWLAFPASLLACLGITQLEEGITDLLFPYGGGLSELLTSFFFSQVDRGGLMLQHVPPVGNQAKVQQGAYLILLVLLAIGILACILGCFAVKKSVRGITATHREKLAGQYEKGHVYVVSGSRFPDAQTPPMLYYDNMDARENLFFLCGAEKQKIEEALALVELDRNDDREKNLKAFEVYPNKVLLYELAAAWLCGNGILELDRADRLDEEDFKGCHELQRSLNRLTEAGCTILLYVEEPEQMERVQRLASCSIS